MDESGQMAVYGVLSVDVEAPRDPWFTKADPCYSRLVLVNLKLVPKEPNEVPVVGLEQSAWSSGGITAVQA